MSTSIVVTSINPPNPVMQMLAEGADQHGYQFIVIGDSKSPDNFTLKNCQFLNLAEQQALPFRYAQSCPTKHYARKNIGYLEALRQGSEVIIETDDDNFPRDAFFAQPEATTTACAISETGWSNIYRYYSDQLIWPRGFPLDRIHNEPPTLPTASDIFTPIQQGLADDNPDVDAIYRLIMPLPQVFKDTNLQVALGTNSWCPFNSQNTKWLKVAAPLLYLPATCSFRMTDIWRSFIAQRIAWANGWHVLFTQATVWQERNEHNLMQDFADEVPGYLHNQRLVDLLSSLDIPAGTDNLGLALTQCYDALIDAGFFTTEERTLLQDWLYDLEQLS